MTTENCRRELTAVCKAANSGCLLQVVQDGSFGPLAEKDLSHWSDWPTFPVDAAHAAGCELVMLGHLIWPDAGTPDSLIGRRAVPDQQARSAKAGTFDPLQTAGI
jgi:hypothetical protein